MRSHTRLSRYQFCLYCSQLRVPCSLFPDHTSKFTESNQIPIGES
ncbi:MAG: hypothetical protein ACK57T_16030 [Dolichospermum sp.]